MTRITVPPHLSAAAKSWFREIAADYAISDRGGLLLLQQAAECWDRAAELRRLIAKDGLFVPRANRFLPLP